MASSILSILTLLVATRPSRAQVYSSMAHLVRVFHVEAEVVQLLRELVNTTGAKMAVVKRYIDDFERMQRDLVAGSDEEVLLSHPIRAFHFIKRLTVEWTAVEQLLKNSSRTDVHRAVTVCRLGVNMPRNQDLQAAAVALLRLQEIYNIQVSEFARGEIFGLRSSIALSARDCFFLGKHSFHVGLFKLASRWYDQALLTSSLEGNSTTLEEEIRPFMLEAVALSTGQEDEQGNGNGASNLNTSEFVDSPPFRLGKDIFPYDDERNYRALCQGQIIRDPKVEARLQCYFSDQKNPYFRLHPVKVEERNTDPPIYIFHDVISDSEIERVKKVARPKLKPSAVLSTSFVDGESVPTRTSQSTWLFDNLEDDPWNNLGHKQQNDNEKHWFFRIMRRVGFITNLKTLGPKNAEGLQVSNYGIAGQYPPHYDYIFEFKGSEKIAVTSYALATGDRIATFLFYFSDVAHGGATVFPRVGAAAWPQKGSAAFWYNLRRSGAVDTLSLHAACPVAYGSKWAGNKWIRERNQLFVRPCGLSPED